MKVIRFDEVQRGDVVSLGDSQSLSFSVESISSYSRFGKKFIELHFGGSAVAREDDHIIGLLHRPWPEGKTEEKMHRRIHQLLSIALVGGLSDEMIDKILEAIEVYKLGLPLEPEKK